MRYLPNLFYCLLIVACTNPAFATDKILVLGDSLSAAYGIDPKEGWVEKLNGKLISNGNNFDVINASISGETTQGGRNRIEKLLSRYEPAVVVIELGANDGLRGLSLATMHDNLAFMIKKSRQSNAAVLLIGVRLPPNYGQDYTDKFHRVYSSLAEQFEIGYTPYLLDGIDEDRSKFQADGLHPTAAAQAQIVENVWPYLAKIIKR